MVGPETKKKPLKHHRISYFQYNNKKYESDAVIPWRGRRLVYVLAISRARTLKRHLVKVWKIMNENS